MFGCVLRAACCWTLALLAALVWPAGPAAAAQRPKGSAASWLARRAAGRLAGRARYAAQSRNKGTGKKPAEPPKKPWKATGTVKAIRSPLLQVITENGAGWLVQVAAKPQDIRYTAEADPYWIRPGAVVQFVGRFTQDGESVAPVEKVRVVSPRPGLRIGAAPYRAADTEDGGDGGSEELVDPFGDLAPGGAATAAAAPYRVVGRVVSRRDSALVVALGRRSVKVELAPDVAVSLELNDGRFVRPGDRVELQGFFYPTRPGLAVANKVSITAARPLLSKQALRERAEQRKEQERSEQQEPLGFDKPDEPAPPP